MASKQVRRYQHVHPSTGTLHWHFIFLFTQLGKLRQVCLHLHWFQDIYLWPRLWYSTQWAGEVISTRDKTDVSDEFKDLEHDVELRRQGLWKSVSPSPNISLLPNLLANRGFTLPVRTDYISRPKLTQMHYQRRKTAKSCPMTNCSL